MTSIRDWCPHCDETGWACRCGKKQASTPSPVVSDEVVGNLRLRSIYSIEQEMREHYAEAADLIAALKADNERMKEVSDETLEKLIRAVLNHSEAHMQTNEIRMHKAAVKAEMLEVLNACTILQEVSR